MRGAKARDEMSGGEIRGDERGEATMGGNE